MMSGKFLLTGFVAISFALPAAAQTPAPPDKLSFEVASVKANKTGDNRMMFGGQPGGGLTATNMPVRELITFAYQLQEFQLIGAPDWINTERFDIVAKASVDGSAAPAPGPPGPPGTEMRARMRSLLEERFKLAAHRDTRPLPVYALVLARPDGKLGAGLRPSTADCEAMRGRGAGQGRPPAPGERPPCGMMMRPGGITSGGTPLSQLLQPLSVFTRRTVVDRTGLKGNFDVDLTWMPDQMPAGPPPPGVQLPPIDPNGPSIFTALQEQLGLKLESQTGPVDVLVIDHVERPTEN
jgi:uncharacterized protein (TIGR03435 family)